MRGSVLVGILLAASAVFAVFAFWFLFSLTPADQRFNQLRNAVPAGVTLTEMLPDPMGDFARLTPQVAPAASEVAATYSDTNVRVNITIKPLKGESQQEEIASNLVVSHCT